MSAVFGVVDLFLEVHLLHLEEGLAGEERVGAGLVLGTDPLHFEFVSNLREKDLMYVGPPKTEETNIKHCSPLEARP